MDFRTGYAADGCGELDPDRYMHGIYRFMPRCARCREPVTEDDLDWWGDRIVHACCAAEMDSNATAIEYITADTTAFENFLSRNADKPHIQELFRDYKDSDRKRFEEWSLG